MKLLLIVELLSSIVDFKSFSYCNYILFYSCYYSGHVINKQPRDPNTKYIADNIWNIKGTFDDISIE